MPLGHWLSMIPKTGLHFVSQSAVNQHGWLRSLRIALCKPIRIYLGTAACRTAEGLASAVQTISWHSSQQTFLQAVEKM
jgi:hypothetical protein